MKKRFGFSLVSAVAICALFTMCNTPAPEEGTPEIVEQAAIEEVKAPVETSTEVIDTTAAATPDSSAQQQ